MVKKLIKYDFASYMRLLLPVQLILLGIAALNRLIQLFEDSGSAVYEIVFGSSVFLYVVSIIVALVLTFVVSIVRFYQGMYTNEGYLNHTLPVSPTQHILSKLIVSVLFYLGTFLAVFLSFMIVTLGEMNIEIFKAAGYLFNQIYMAYGGSAVLYILEIILLVLAAIISTTLCIYFCISVGQLAQKRKILLAFGVYFGLYVAGQIIGTILIIIFATVGPYVVNGLRDWAVQNFSAFLHISFTGGIVIELIGALVYFLLTRFFMSKKLNLT